MEDPTNSLEASMNSDDLGAMAQPESVLNNLCCEADCENVSAGTCEYLDWQQNQCGTHWCQNHLNVVDGHNYCRRHVNIAESLLEAEAEGQTAVKPELYNRTPNLVKWMMQALDRGVQDILNKASRNHPEVKVLSSQLIIAGVYPQRNWKYVWLLNHKDAEMLRIWVEVREDDDKVVRVGLDDMVLSEAVPPWITIDGATPAKDSASQRSKYVKELLRLIKDAVASASSSLWEVRPQTKPLNIDDSLSNESNKNPIIEFLDDISQ